MAADRKRNCAPIAFWLFCVAVIISSPAGAQSGSVDPMTWLNKDSVAGTIFGQTVESVGRALAAAAQVRREAYGRQMEIEYAQKALGKCDHCSDEAALKARVDSLIAADEKLHRDVDAMAGHNTGMAAVLHILMDPTGQRDQRYRRTLNFENLINDFCYVDSQKEEDAERACLKSLSMEILDHQASVASKFCKDAVAVKYGVNNPAGYALEPPPNNPPKDGRDFFLLCLENTTLAYAMMRKVAEVCALKIEDIKRQAPGFYELVKTCNPDPGGPPGTPKQIVESARDLLDTGTPEAAERAYALFSRMAAKHDPPAMYYAGQALLRGVGVKKNEVAAFDLFRQAADRGNQNAMVALALMYKNGTTVPQDYKSALHYLQYVSWQSESGPAADASIVLARMYASGDGVPRNEQEAASLYLKASSHQSHRRDPKGRMTRQVEHPEYRWEAANWLIEHKYVQDGVNILASTDVAEFRFEAVKLYMKGWTDADGRTQSPNLKQATFLLSILLRDPDPEIRQRAEAIYNTIPEADRPRARVPARR